jgi:hypothetical protein
MAQSTKNGILAKLKGELRYIDDMDSECTQDLNDFIDYDTDN